MRCFSLCYDDGMVEMGIEMEWNRMEWMVGILVFSSSLPYTCFFCLDTYTGAISARHFRNPGRLVLLLLELRLHLLELRLHHPRPLPFPFPSVSPSISLPTPTSTPTPTTIASSLYSSHQPFFLPRSGRASRDVDFFFARITHLWKGSTMEVVCMGYW